MKPGYQSSEFWLTVATMIFGAILSSGLICTDHDGSFAKVACKIIGGLVTVLGLLGYQKARSTVKAAGVAADALGRDGAYDPTKSGGGR